MQDLARSLLPGDVELARRSAGGDAAAFVRLYDRYSGQVFAASLAATGSVEHAAIATQVAFLKLLKRPPAMAAPERDVTERLRGMALGPGIEEAPGIQPGESADGHGVRAAWLRSETVAKAGARFDEDWSGYLTPAPRDRHTVGELAQAWHREVAGELSRLEGVASERPLADEDAVEPQRRRVGAWFRRRPRPTRPASRVRRSAARAVAGARD